MDYPDTLNNNNYASKSQKFDDLLAEGISFIQKFSGNNWTDYNYHDPGITILEQLCFAITDLGYKSHFRIEDILMYGVDDFDFENDNLFIRPEKIFSSNISNVNDYRKILIDSIPEINNAWIDIIDGNKHNIDGIFNIKLQLKDHLVKDLNNKVIDKTKNIILKHRVLSTDLNEVIILKKDIISIGCNVIIDSFCVGEEILAKIFIKIEKRLNEKAKYVGLDFFENKDIPTDEIYQGVETKNGIILDSSLYEKTNQIFVSELIEIIKNIEGVLNIKDFEIFKNGIKIFDDIITFSDSFYPSFEDIDTYFSDNSEGEINFIRNNSNYEIDSTIFSQLYDSQSANNINTFSKTNVSNSINKGRFLLEQISNYYSVINEFPTIYGLKENELSSDSSDLRIAQMKQLKSYLLLFDQILNNYLAQLVNIRKLFSTQNLGQTYFTQIPLDISGMSEIVKTNDLDKYKLNINKAIEDEVSFIKRRNKFIDHILSRFGESYNSELLKKIYQDNNPELPEIKCDLYAINCKINYLKNIALLGKNRNKGQDFVNIDSNKENKSGLETRLRLLLDIGFDNNFIDDDKRYKTFNFKEKFKWSIIEISIKNGPNVNVLSLPNSCYKNDEVNFYLRNYTQFKDLFINAIKKKSFNILNDGDKYILIYNNKEISNPVKIFESSKRSNCLNKINYINNKIKNLNKRSEDLIILENILFRPINNDRFLINILIDQGKEIFKSSKMDEFSNLNETREDLKLILSDRSNYTIHKANSDINKFMISVYDIMDKKILISSNYFDKKIDAKNFIDDFIENYLLKSKFTIDINSSATGTNIFPDNFNFSNEINIIFPSWPKRFQNIEFKKYISKVVDDFVPANINYNIHYLNFKSFQEISKTFSKWKVLKSDGDKASIDNLSLQIVQFLIREINV